MRINEFTAPEGVFRKRRLQDAAQRVITQNLNGREQLRVQSTTQTASTFALEELYREAWSHQTTCTTTPVRIKTKDDS